MEKALLLYTAVATALFVYVLGLSFMTIEQKILLLFAGTVVAFAVMALILLYSIHVQLGQTNRLIGSVVEQEKESNEVE